MLTFVGCRQFEIENLNNNQIGAIGHAGMGFIHQLPPNSIESIARCLYVGADGVEIDVQMTSDSVLVAFHDERLEHSTDCEGAIYDLAWADVQEAEYDYPPYTEYVVANLHEVFEFLGEKNDHQFFLDCKNFGQYTSQEYGETFVRQVVSLIELHGLESNVFVEMRDRRMIGYARDNFPNLEIFIAADYHTALDLAEEFDLTGITVEADEISLEQIRSAHDDSLLVTLFDIDYKAENIDAIEKNPDFIQTDKVRHLVNVLK